MRRFLRFLFRFFVVLIALVLTLWVVLQLPPVQTFIVGKIAKNISETTGYDVRVGGVDLRFPLELILREVEVLDLERDTLLRADGVHLRAIELDLSKAKFHTHRVELIEPYFRLIQLEGDSLTNLDKLLAFVDDSEGSDSSNVLISTDEVKIREGRFEFHDFNYDYKAEAVDFNHIEVSALNTYVRNFNLTGGDIDADIRYLRFNEHSGFQLSELKGHFAMRSDTLRLEDYRLETPRTSFGGHLIFAFEDMSDFSDFLQKVNMRGRLEDSHVHFEDIAFFAEDLKGLDRTVTFNGRFWGTVANLKVRQMELELDENTRLLGKIDLAGLPDFSSTFIDLTIDELTSVKAELDQIPLPPFNESKTIQTPKNISTLGQIRFAGKFTGFITDFVAFGNLTTAIGSVRSDLKFKETPTTYEYNGELKTEAFNLGRFYNTTDLGKLTSSLKVKGSGLTRDDLDASISGRIHSLRVKNYPYRDIVASGKFKQNFFNGEVAINDKNVQLHFNGLIDFTEKKPRFDFNTAITHFDPIALNLVTLQGYTSLSGDFRIQAEGLKFNEINGQIIGDSVRFCTLTDEYPIEHFELFMTQNDETGKRFKLESDIATGRLEGKFDFTGLESGVKQIVSDIIPQIAPPPTHQRGREDFYLEITIHNFELVSQVFMPELNIARGSRFSLLMDDMTGDFKSTFTSDRISYESMVMDTLLIDLSHPDESLYITFQADQADFGLGFTFPSFTVDSYNERDTVYTNLVWGEETDLLSGDLSLISRIRGNKNVSNTLNSFRLNFAQENWNLVTTSTIDIDSNRYNIRDFHLAKGSEFVKIDGVISEDPKEQVVVDLQGIELSLFNALLEESGIEQHGLVTGNVTLRDVYNRLLISSDLLVMDYTINGNHIGDFCAESSWDPDHQRLIIAGDFEHRKTKQLTFAGFYYPNDPENELDVNFGITGFPIDVASAFIEEGISNLEGTLTGSLHVGGMLAAPLVDGEIKLADASLKVDYLNTTYRLGEKVSVTSDMIAFNFPIIDEEDNRGFIVGTLLHDSFTDWNFDMFLDLEQSPFLLLNTTMEQNSLYFGKAYASGFINVSGRFDDIVIDVNAKSERGTSIALPLGGSDDVTFADFVSFIDHSKESTEEDALDFSGITMNFELDITPDAQFRIIFDEVVGGEIRGRGTGHIRMEIGSLNSFNMFGNIAVEQGRYLFTLKNLINKEFEVMPGGTITWFGDPLTADVNLQALYRVNTSLYELFPEQSEQYKQRVPVNLIMNLDGKLLNPGIEFDIYLPNSDELTRARVNSAINNQQEVNRQAFALLVLRRFISPPDIARTNTSIGLAENSTELVTSQLSNWLSQISDDFDIGVNYSPGDQISNEELAVALSTQLFNDRLLVSGSFGVQQAQSSVANENPNNLIGDIRIEYKIHPEGKIRIIVYNQSNEFDLARSRQNAYTQGFGIVFQQEFSTIYDLFGIPVPN